MKKSTAAMHAQKYETLFSVNNDGMKKLDIPTNKKQKSAELKKNDGGKIENFNFWKIEFLKNSIFWLLVFGILLLVFGYWYFGI